MVSVLCSQRGWVTREENGTKESSIVGFRVQTKVLLRRSDISIMLVVGVLEMPIFSSQRCLKSLCIILNPSKVASKSLWKRFVKELCKLHDISHAQWWGHHMTYRKLGSGAPAHVHTYIRRFKYSSSPPTLRNYHAHVPLTSISLHKFERWTVDRTSRGWTRGMHC